jgi:hypothetical protein
LITIGFSVIGSGPISRSGGAAARRCRTFGAASNASASSSETVKSLSSLSRDRKSSPRLTYGPYRPLAATISAPSGSLPRLRGSWSSFSACSSVTVSGDCVLSSEDLRSPLETYGP